MSASFAIPTIKSLSDAANFDIAVRPFLYQLQTVPVQVIDIVARSDGSVPVFESLAGLYTQSNPLVLAFMLSVVLGGVFFLAAEVNRNYSQVDRFWSILPFIYVAHYFAWARSNGIASPKLLAALTIVGAWSGRLTFNYWRKGGYSIGSEDYRWAIIKEYIGGVGMFLLNLTFISWIQSVRGLFLAQLDRY
jgi:steroid 5-alpha reductase family enzyme